MALFDRFRKRSHAFGNVAWFNPSNLTANVPPSGAQAAQLAARPEQALGVPAVYGAVGLIARAIAGLDWQALRIADGQPVERQPAIVRKPDPDNPISVTKEQLLTPLLLHGEAFVFLTAHGRDGLPTIGLPISNDQVTITWNSNRTRPIYRIGDQPVRLWRDLLHIKYLSAVGELHGIGPIQAARISVTGSLNAEGMANEQWTNGGPPIDGVVTVPGKLTKDEADIHRAQWTERALTRTPAFLSGGMAFQQVRLSNADLQFLESRNYGVLDVCRLFGIPPKFLAAELGGSSLSYSNNQEAYVDLIRQAYIPVADRLEVAFGEAIPTTQRVQTNYSSLLRADIRTRFDTYSIARTNGILTVNEIRALENLTPLPGGNDPTARTVAVPMSQTETITEDVDV